VKIIGLPISSKLFHGETRSWSAALVAEALDGDAHTIGSWEEDLRQKGPEDLAFDQTQHANFTVKWL
jgi:hypothetical protein